ncbi:MAG: energy-coupling factor transporter ATPase [Bifidobacterium pullorum]
MTAQPTDDVAVALRGVRFSYGNGATWALDGVDLTVRAGERVCIVGPNGSGKSTLSRIVAGLAAPDAGTVTVLGERVFDGDAGPDPDAYRRARRGIGAVFQNPEDQLVTTVVEDDVAFGPENLGIAHDDIGRCIAEALQAVDMTESRAVDPTVMSGGQQQRIAIAGTMAMHPAMVVFDEPTAMLDGAARAEVMAVLDSLQARGVTIVHITHHADETLRADRVIRMESGQIVSEGRPRRDDAARAASADQPHPPADGGDEPQPDSEPIIAVEHVFFTYPGQTSPVIDDLSLSIARGETVALMGHNGAGKTTLARLLCALERPDDGSITVAGVPVALARGGRRDTARERRSGTAGTGHVRKPRTASRTQRRALRRHVGYVMQHPERQLFADTVTQDVAYGPRSQGLPEAAVREHVEWALQLLRIGHLADRSPFALSGGQQRLAAIAGVLACRPDALIMDEPTAGLDARASARIHDLIRTLRAQGVTVLVITHSAAEAAAMGARIITMGQPPHTQSARTGAEGSGPLGTLDPRVKMVTFLVLMFTAFAISNAWQLGLAAALAAGIIAVGRLNPLRLLAAVRLILSMLVVMGLLNLFFARGGDVLAAWGPLTITTGGVQTAALYTLRFALVVVLGAVMMETTTPTALTDAIGSLLSPLRRFGVHTQEIALVLSLALRFLPTLAREAHAVIDAQSARGGDIETGSPAKRLRALTAIVVPVFAGTLRHADNLALALDARCYEEGTHRTHWRRMRVRRRDLLFVTVAMLYLFALMALRIFIQ